MCWSIYNIYARTQDFGTYHIAMQQRLRQVCVYTQTPQNLPCLYVHEDANFNLDPKPGWAFIGGLYTCEEYQNFTGSYIFINVKYFFLLLIFLVSVIFLYIIKLNK